MLPVTPLPPLPSTPFFSLVGVLVSQLGATQCILFGWSHTNGIMYALLDFLGRYSLGVTKTRRSKGSMLDYIVLCADCYLWATRRTKTFCVECVDHLQTVIATKTSHFRVLVDTKMRPDTFAPHKTGTDAAHIETYRFQQIHGLQWPSILVTSPTPTLQVTQCPLRVILIKTETVIVVKKGTGKC